MVRNVLKPANSLYNRKQVKIHDNWPNTFKAYIFSSLVLHLHLMIIKKILLL